MIDRSNPMNIEMVSSVKFQILMILNLFDLIPIKDAIEYEPIKNIINEIINHTNIK